ncbi:hypothetical protein C8R47DRAFT_305676 [Mycena vitilis]|nr:hypothetical protein C8R47DRAFT_305676 [Mycena vitilis]
MSASAFLGPPSGPTTRAEFVEEKARKGKSVKGKKKATTAAAAQDEPDGLVEEAPKASRVKYLRGSATNNTARNLCLLAYRAKHGKAPEDEFNAYFTTLTPEQMKVRSLNSIRPAANLLLDLGRHERDEGGCQEVFGVAKSSRRVCIWLRSVRVACYPHVFKSWELSMVATVHQHRLLLFSLDRSAGWCEVAAGGAWKEAD